MRFYEIKDDVFIDINHISVIRVERSTDFNKPDRKFRVNFTLKDNAKINSKAFETLEDARKMIKDINLEVSNYEKK